MRVKHLPRRFQERHGCLQENHMWRVRRHRRLQENQSWFKQDARRLVRNVLLSCRCVPFFAKIVEFGGKVVISKTLCYSEENMKQFEKKKKEAIHGK
jgi:hypothetical protein